MGPIPLILVISPVLFALLYWCWSSLMSAEVHGSGSADRTDALEASRGLEQVRGPAPVYADAQSKPLAR